MGKVGSEQLQTRQLSSVRGEEERTLRGTALAALLGAPVFKRPSERQGSSRCLQKKKLRLKDLSKPHREERRPRRLEPRAPASQSGSYLQPHAFSAQTSVVCLVWPSPATPAYITSKEDVLNWPCQWRHVAVLLLPSSALPSICQLFNARRFSD